MKYQDFLKKFKEEEIDILYLKKISKLSYKEFAEKYKIPIRTIEKWCNKERKPTAYLIQLLAYAVFKDIDEI